MFESSFITLLSADADLQNLLPVFESGLSIFSNAAPQKAVLPYIVFDIDKRSTEGLIVSEFDVNIDVWHRIESGKELRQIAERIEFICDRKEIKTDLRFDTIRLFYDSGREVENTDIKIRHYVLMLSARGNRQKWAEQI